MARPLKTGLEYFPLDVDFFEDDKIQLIAAEYGGAKAECLIIRLLCKIYKNGYYYQWGKDQCLLILKSMGTVDCSTEWVQEVIQGLVRRCFFDKGCFDEFEILTSSAIQRRYLSAIKERKTSDDNRRYWLLSSDETLETDINRRETTVNRRETIVNPPINTQSRVKESKVNKSKVNESREEEETCYCTLPDTAPFKNLKNDLGNGDFEVITTIEFYKREYPKLVRWIEKNTPQVSHIKSPFTYVELYHCWYETSAYHNSKLFKEILEEMNNKSDLLDRYYSAYTTFKSFHKQKKLNK